MPGVWPLPVDNINAECFSLLGSWSFQTRIPQRTHAQLYGIVYGILESTHQVRAPPAQWAQLEVPFEAAARGGAVILADDRDANKATCVYSCISRRKCCKRNIPGHTGLVFKKVTFAHFFSPNMFWAFLTGYVLGTEVLETFVLHACSRLSNPSVSWTLGFVGAAKLDILFFEKSH